MSSSRTFLLGLLCVLPAYALLMALTFLVDPRGSVSAVFPSAGSLCPPGIRLMRRAAIPYIAPARHPREILVGTSRVAFGFAAADAERLLHGPVANLALESANFDEAAALVRQSWAGGSVRRVWIGLDYIMFVDTPPAPLARYRAIGRLPAAIVYGLMEPAAIRYAIGHVTRDRGHCPPPYASVLGFADADVQSRMATDEKGFAAQLAIWRPHPRRQPVSTASQTMATRLATLEALVAEGQARGVRLVLFTAPVHLQMRRATIRGGQAGLHERWMRAVRGIVARHPAAGVRLIDLAHVVLPEQRDGQRCARTGHPSCLFYDSTHYRPPLGRRILEIGTEAERREVKDHR